MKLFLNPYTGSLCDWESIEGTSTGEGVAKFCPITGKPLNKPALHATGYPGPEVDRELWLKDQEALMDKIALQVEEPNTTTVANHVEPAPAAAPTP